MGTDALPTKQALSYGILPLMADCCLSANNVGQKPTPRSWIREKLSNAVPVAMKFLSHYKAITYVRATRLEKWQNHENAR